MTMSTSGSIAIPEKEQGFRPFVEGVACPDGSCFLYISLKDSPLGLIGMLALYSSFLFISPLTNSVSFTFGTRSVSASTFDSDLHDPRTNTLMNS